MVGYIDCRYKEGTKRLIIFLGSVRNKYNNIGICDTHNYDHHHAKQQGSPHSASHTTKPQLYAKTLHAQLKQNILRYTCVFSKELTVNINSKHSQQLCKSLENPIQTWLETFIRLMDLRCLLTWTPSSELHTSAWLSLVHYTWCYKH